MAKKPKQKFSKSQLAYKKEISRIKSAIGTAKSKGWKLPSYDVSYYIPEHGKVIRPSDVKKLKAVDYERIIKQGTKGYFSGKGFFKENLSYTEYRQAQKENRRRSRKTKYWQKQGARVSWDFFGNEIVSKNGVDIRVNGEPIQPPAIPQDNEPQYDPYEYEPQEWDNIAEYTPPPPTPEDERDAISQAEVIIDNLRDDVKSIFDFHSHEPKYLYNQDWMEILLNSYSRIDSALLQAKRSNDYDFANYIIANGWQMTDAANKWDEALYGSSPQEIEMAATEYIQLLEQGLGTSIFTLRTLSMLDEGLSGFSEP